MNILLTGSSGLVGQHLLKKLSEMKVKVIGYDVKSNNLNYSNYKFQQGNLEDFPRLAGIVKENNIDIIIHSGGISHPIIGSDSPNQVIQTNIVGTTNVYEVARLFNIERVIYLSSASVYGSNKKNNLTEKERPTPDNIYGISKLTGDYLAEVYNKKYSMKIVSLRLAFVYGPSRKMPDPIKKIIDSAVKGSDINEECGNDQKIEFIYIKDVIKALLLIINKWDVNEDVKEGIYNIGTEKLTSINDIVRIIKEKYPNFNVKLGPGEMGYGSIGNFNCTKARDFLNFKPSFTLREGILDYLEELKL